MTYDEYQVYFHAFNNAYSALAGTLRPGGEAGSYGVNSQCNLNVIYSESKNIANRLLEVYKTVEKPVVPDLTSAVETAFKNFGKGSKK